MTRSWADEFSRSAPEASAVVTRIRVWPDSKQRLTTSRLSPARRRLPREIPVLVAHIGRWDGKRIRRGQKMSAPIRAEAAAQGLPGATSDAELNRQRRSAQNGWSDQPP